MVAGSDCPFVKQRAGLSDDEYFAALSGEVFRMIIGTGPVVKRWPEIKHAFDNFSVEKLSGYGEKDVQRLMVNAGIVRNRKKIEATIKNAMAFKQIRQEHDSFESYLRSFNGDIDRLVADLDDRIHYIGVPSIRRFLNCVGVDLGRGAVETV